MTLTLWLITDQKPGHKNQLIGLEQALQNLTEIDSHWINIDTPNTPIQKPDLIVCCGHRTHWRSLWYRWRYGGKLCALMKPSLPLSWFDLCVIPSHDSPPQRANVIATQGVLNKITPSDDHDDSKGLILLGGPSKHFKWDNETVLTRTQQILEENPLKWTIGTSRRTPDQLTNQLRETLGSITIETPDSVSSDWLPQQLARSKYVWVSADSVSMVYEALTSGAQTHIIDLPEVNKSRVAKGLNNLVLKRLVSTTIQVDTTAITTQFDEASRIAKQVVSIAHNCD